MTALRDRIAPRLGPSFRVVATTATLLAIASCSPPSRDLQPGRYRAALQTQGGELPFALQAMRNSQQFELVAVSGDDRVALRDIELWPGRLAARWPDGGGRLTATIEGGYLRGEVALTGTVRTDTFEHRVAGEVHGDELRLAHFDGRAGQLYVAKVNARGELEGDAWTLAATHLRFVAVRNPDAELEVAPVTGAAAQPEAASP